MVDLSDLLELGGLARAEGQRHLRRRPVFDDLVAESGRHAVGIVGPRGVGKTVVLKQLAASIPDSLYISVDTLGELDLFKTAQSLRDGYGVRTLLLDEIHFSGDFPSALKKVFDFLDVRVFFTSSVALSLYDTAVDLSRRTRLIPLYPFSFREFVRFRTNEELPEMGLDDVMSMNWTPAHMRTEYLFDEYLHGGLMPFALDEPAILPLLRNVIETVVRSDIPRTARLAIEELPLIHKCLSFVGQSTVDGINYSSISRNVGITKYKAESYVSLLQKAFVLNVVLPAGSSVTREPKILMCVPYRLLYAQGSAAVGGLREDYFVEAMRSLNVDVRYLKSMRGAKTPDYLVTVGGVEYIIEIGGKGKGREQFKGITGEKQLILTHPADISGIRRPLFMTGFISPKSIPGQ